jgi:exodeoxyribonuclease V gamma subunit
MTLARETYLGPADDDDTYDLERVSGVLRSVAELDRLGNPVTYRVAWELVRAGLEGLEVSRGAYLADGVVVSSFQPMRPIPFRHIFVMGLGEGNFPVTDPNDPLDLRRADPQLGDILGRERDEYMFLETLLSARDRVWLSYVGQNDRTGDPLEPSSVIRELLYVLDINYVDRDRFLAENTVHVPLRRFDAAYFPELSAEAELAGRPEYRSLHPDARREAATVAVRDALRTWCDTNLIEHPDLQTLRGTLPVDTWTALSRLLVVPTEPPVSAQADARTEVSLAQLRQFLRTPLQARASLQLGRGDDGPEDLLEREDEVFHTEFLDRLSALRAVVHEHLAGENPTDLPSLLSAYERRAEVLELMGIRPTGVFGERDQDADRETLSAWMFGLQNLGVVVEEPPRIVAFGRAPEAMRVSERAPAIELSVGSPARNVRLTGATGMLVDGERTALTFSLASAASVGAEHPRHFASGFLDLMACVAAGRVQGPVDIAVVPIGAASRAEWRWELVEVTQANALAWLSQLVDDYLATDAPYLFPLEAACVYWDRLESNRERAAQYSRSVRPPDAARIVKEVFYASRGRGAFTRGPVRRPQDFGPPPDALELVERRFGIFFRHGRVRGNA